jgi:hypothetical protein
MKRFGAWAVLASLLVGCDSGIQEGAPPDAAKASPQPPGFQEQMEKNTKNMQMKNQPRPKADNTKPAS